MKSKLISASVLAFAALAAGSSFAEGRDIYPASNASAVSTKTRADVQAELAQAQRNGYNVNIGRNWTGDNAVSTSNRSRDEVRREAASAVVSTSALEHDYPVVR